MRAYAREGLVHPQPQALKGHTAATWKIASGDAKLVGMCNLYSMTRNREAILRLFRVSDNRAATIDPQPSIFPAYTAPVVRKAADGERELVTMSWGFVLLTGRQGTASRHECARRQDTDEQVLEAIIRGAPLPRASVKLLRTERTKPLRLGIGSL